MINNLETIPETFEECGTYKKHINSGKNVEYILGNLCCNNYDCEANSGHYRIVRGHMVPGPVIGYESLPDTGGCLLQNYNKDEISKLVSDVLSENESRLKKITSIVGTVFKKVAYKKGKVVRKPSLTIF